MILDDFNEGPVADWLSLAESEAQKRCLNFKRNPVTSKSTFLVENESIAGKIRTSEEPERNHPRIWHQYDDEPFMKRAHPDARVITVALDLADPVETFDSETDYFIVVDDSDRPHLPGSEEKPYFYIENRGDYYYNGTNSRVSLPANSWDAVFDM